MSFVIKHTRQKGSAFVLMLMIAHHAHADGTGSYPSIDTLARECRITARQVKRLLPELEASGELVVFWSRGRKPHEYAIPMGKINSDILSLLKIEYEKRKGAFNSDIFSPLTVTKCHGSEIPTVTSAQANSDIYDTPTVTFEAEKPRPHNILFKPSLEPSLEQLIDPLSHEHPEQDRRLIEIAVIQTLIRRNGSKEKINSLAYFAPEIEKVCHEAATGRPSESVPPMSSRGIDSMLGVRRKQYEKHVQAKTPDTVFNTS